MSARAALTFEARLARAVAASKGLLCVGLDPDLTKIPEDLRRQAADGDPGSILAFNRRVIDATAALTAAYKPQVAFYSAVGAESALEATIRHIRERAPSALVILDGKRNDIGNTAAAYAREAFDRYDADAVTVNPYMGEDAVRPFLEREDKGAILLCRTSNAGARDFQDLRVVDPLRTESALPLYRHVAAAAARWNERRNVMLVVGATYPAEMRELRQAHPELPFLVPGIGAQGGDLDATLSAGLDGAGGRLLINSSRGIIYAGSGNGADIGSAARTLRDAINDRRARLRDERRYDDAMGAVTQTASR